MQNAQNIFVVKKINYLGQGGIVIQIPCFQARVNIRRSRKHLQLLIQECKNIFQAIHSKKKNKKTTNNNNNNTQH